MGGEGELGRGQGAGPGAGPGVGPGAAHVVPRLLSLRATAPKSSLKAVPKMLSRTLQMPE